VISNRHPNSILNGRAADFGAMSVSWVPLTSDRVPLCASLWSDRPAYTQSEFARALRRLETLLKEGRANGALIFEGERIRAFGTSLFVEAGVVEQFLSAPSPQLGKRLLLDDQSTPACDAVLDKARIGVGNSSTGLQLVVVNSNYDPEAHDVNAVLGSLMSAFQGVHRGYRIVRIVTEVHGDHAIEAMETSRSFDIHHRCTDVSGVKGLSSAIGMLTREQAAAARNLLLPVFVYAPPRIFFTESEQQVLRVALTGATEVVAAEVLRLPLTAIKARWARLLERAFAAVPELLSGPVPDRNAAGRGPQSRHLVVEYVRQHPSELTPYARH